MRRLALVFCILLISALGSAAQNTTAQQNKKAKLEKEIRMIEQQLKENSSKSSNALSTLSLIQKKVSVRKALVAESENELKEISDSISACQSRIDMIKARLDTMNLYYDRLVRNAYKNRDTRVWYIYILSSNTIGQASRRYGYLRNLSNQMNTQARRIQETKDRLEQQKADMTVLREKASAVKDARLSELGRLEQEEAQSKKLIAQLKNEKAKYTQQLSNKKKQVEALNKEIEKIIRSAMEDPGKTSKTKKPKAPVDYKLAGEFEANKGKLPWPAEGPVLEHFGQHNHPVYTSLVMPFNNGINIGVARNARVKAVFDGEVKRIIVMPGYNKCVLVQHGSYFTFYCKLSTVSVKAGQKIKTGDEIGFVDTIDGQTQLHFQLWNGNKPQNPEPWLRPQ